MADQDGGPDTGHGFFVLLNELFHGFTLFGE